MKDLQDSPVALSSGAWILAGATNIGIIADFGMKQTQPDIYLVDSGGDAGSGKRIHSALEELFPDGFLLKAIICTHSNADHTGGNAWLQENTGCGVWTSLEERGSVENPFLEPVIIWGGYPFQEINGKNYLAPPSCVTRILSPEETISLGDGGSIRFVSLPGHYLGMIGVLYENPNGERVFFLGDSVFGRHVIKKYWIPFLLDVEAFKQTLEKIAGVPANFYIPSHGDIQSDIDALCELNMIAILETESSIIAALKTERTPEELLKHIADINGIRLGDGQYVLIGSTLRSYLSYLQRQGKITHRIVENRMLWCVAP